MFLSVILGILNSVIKLYALRAIQYLKTFILEIQMLDGFGPIFLPCALANIPSPRFRLRLNACGASIADPRSALRPKMLFPLAN